jgi:peptide/nickel transport system substrate-binding protein
MDTIAKNAVGSLAILAMAAMAAPAGAATAPDVLVIGKAADPQMLDPAVTMDNNDWTITYPCYQHLVRYKNVSGKATSSVEGELAQSWTSSADGQTWEFKLKPGLKFADGSPLDAQAVQFSFDRLFKIKQGPADPFPEGTTVTAVDPTTVRFQLKTPFAPFLYILAIDGAGIVSPKVMDHQTSGDLGQAWLAGHTAGSGAFQLTSWEKGQTLVLDVNPNYSGPRPTLSKVMVKIVPEASARRLQLEGGDLDIAEDLPTDQLDALAKEAAAKGVTVSDYPSFKVTYLYLNNQKPPLDKVDVRRAVVEAVDVPAIIEGIMLNKAKPMGGPIPLGMWGHDDSLSPVKPDTAKAKALLENAAADLSLNFLLSDRDPAWQPIAVAVQANLADAGIKVNLQQMANATMRERIAKKDYDISIGNWTPDFSDPYMFMNYWFDTRNQGLPGNRSFYANPKVDELLHKAVEMTGQDERTKLYQEAQKIVVDDAAYVYLFQRNSQIASRSDVRGFIYNPMLEYIYNIDQMSKAR